MDFPRKRPIMEKVFPCHNVVMHIYFHYICLFAYIKILHGTIIIFSPCEWVYELWCFMQRFAIYWPHSMVPSCLDWFVILHDHWGCLEETWTCSMQVIVMHANCIYLTQGQGHYIHEIWKFTIQWHQHLGIHHICVDNFVWKLSYICCQYTVNNLIAG